MENWVWRELEKGKNRFLMEEKVPLTLLPKNISSLCPKEWILKSYFTRSASSLLSEASEVSRTATIVTGWKFSYRKPSLILQDWAVPPLYVCANSALYFLYDSNLSNRMVITVCPSHVLASALWGQTPGLFSAQISCCVIWIYLRLHCSTNLLFPHMNIPRHVSKRTSVILEFKINNTFARYNSFTLSK